MLVLRPESSLARLTFLSGLVSLVCLALPACGGSAATGGTSDAGTGDAGTVTTDATSPSATDAAPLLDSPSTAEAAPPAVLAGTWTYDGAVGGTHVNATLTFGPGEAFQLVEQLAPIVGPPGIGPPAGCATTDTYLGTYAAAAIAGGESTVAWTVTGGTVNAVLGCDDGGNDEPGGPMTPADVSAYQSEGLAPPAVDAYAQTATTLTFTAQTDSGGNSGFAGTIGFVGSP